MSKLVEVKVYKKAKHFQRDAQRMAKKGWVVQSQSARTKKWSFLTGFFTNKGKITVTYVRAQNVSV